MEATISCEQALPEAITSLPGRLTSSCPAPLVCRHTASSNREEGLLVDCLSRYFSTFQKKSSRISVILGTDSQKMREFKMEDFLMVTFNGC